MTEAQRVPFDHDQAFPAMPEAEPKQQLDPDEDAELRRLHMLRGFGKVASSISSRYAALRGRDRRRQVREPDEAKLAIPVEKTMWSEGQNLMSGPPLQPDKHRAVTEPEPASATERVISDTREIFGELPESRRGLGIFRR